MAYRFKYLRTDSRATRYKKNQQVKNCMKTKVQNVIKSTVE